MSDSEKDPVQRFLLGLKQERGDITDVALGGPGQPHTVFFNDKIYLRPETLEKLFSHNYIITEARGEAVTLSPLDFPDFEGIPMEKWDSHASEYGLLADEEK